MERRKLEEMPFDKRITLADGSEELAHATGYEVVIGTNPNGNPFWANEYLGSDGEIYY